MLSVPKKSVSFLQIFTEFLMYYFLILHLDDGSSSCCCWANKTSAATFLRLDEGIPREATPREKGFGSSITQVDKILKQHRRVVVKNYGSVFDSLGQGLSFSVGSDNIISGSDEELLKFIILNSCFTGPWVSSYSTHHYHNLHHKYKYTTYWRQFFKK